jgi:serine/threonine protein kinase
MIPTKIGRYEIKAELGRGGMATVYRAYDPSFDREVAIKVLPREFLHDPQFHDRFQHEIKTIALLEHPAIVPVYDVGDDNSLPYFVMRFMTGGSLADWIRKRKFSLQDTARIIERISQALSYAHKKGVIHRDLKPDNILFDGNGDAFISDFGVAKFAEAASTLTGSGIIGTPAYMSPEQAQGEHVDSRSDIYGLGVIIYQMLSGRQPYNADTPMGVVVKHITEPVPEILNHIPSLPDGVDVVIKTAMAKNKDKRYSTATDLAHALNVAAFGAKGDEPLSVSGGRPSAHSYGGYRTGFIVGGIVALVALAGVFLLRNQLFVPVQATATAEPTVIVTPTRQLPISAFEPTAEATATATPFAPFCPAEVVPQIAVPVVKETNKTCTKKSPYTTIAIPQGSTFEPLSQGFSCANAGIVNGKLLISCTGKQLFSFNLKVCNPPLNTPTPAPNTGKCPQGANYDATNQCCMDLSAKDAACTIFRVDLRACSN